MFTFKLVFLEAEELDFYDKRGKLCQEDWSFNTRNELLFSINQFTYYIENHDNSGNTMA